MAFILNIDTSSHLCSVCIAHDGEVVAIAENDSGRDHAAVITLLIDQIHKESGVTLNQLSAVAINQGPGSYTGLRIGMATAKGICYALALPLIALSTTQILARKMKDLSVPDASHWYIPVVPSRKGEWYAAAYDHLLNETVPPKPVPEGFNPSEWLPEGTLGVMGGIPLNNLNPNNVKMPFTLIPALNHSSANLARLSYESHQISNYKSLIYCEPLYLQDVYIGTGTASKEPVKR